MVAVAVLLFTLLSDSERSVGDANIVARQQAAESLFAEQRRAAARPLALVARDEEFGDALVDGDMARAQRRAEQLLTTRNAERIVFVQGGVAVVKAGDKTAIAP